jgi:glutathione synthase/RimK-type ligase-like ATP-grasp enzyme
MRTHCIKAAKAMDLKVAGVDIIHLQRTFVAGVNSGLEGHWKGLKDIAGEMIKDY